MQGGCPSFEKISSRFHMLNRLVTTYQQMSNVTVKFSAKFGAISLFPRNYRERGEESNHGILKLHHTPQLFVTYPRAGSEIKGIAKERNTETSNGGKTLVLNTANNK